MRLIGHCFEQRVCYHQKGQKGILFFYKTVKGGSMPQYAILRFAKHKGGSAGALEAHHERRKEKYASNPDIDITRSKDNFHVIQPQNRYKQEIEKRIQTAGCKTRKDSTRFVDTMITASPQFFNGKSKQEIRAYFMEAVKFIAQRIGKDNIFSAVVHMDEKTPHLHLCFTPITEDGRLSAKEILGNRAQLSKWQDDFYAYMFQSFPDLERGESSLKTGRKHIPTSIFKQAVHLTRQAAKIRTLLADVGPLNARKRTEEISSLLIKWFPKMESFETQLKRYKKGFATLEKKNTELANKAVMNKDDRMKRRIEVAKLESDYLDLKRFVESIPEDMKKQIKDIQCNAERIQTRGR